jgi:hypothetical protein
MAKIGKVSVVQIEGDLYLKLTHEQRKTLGVDGASRLDCRLEDSQIKIFGKPSNLHQAAMIRRQTRRLPRL